MAAVAQPLCSLVLCLVPAIGGAHKSVAAGHLIIVIISSIPIIIPIIISIRSGNLVANWDANLVPVAPRPPPFLFLLLAVRIFVAQFATQIINSKWKL